MTIVNGQKKKKKQKEVLEIKMLGLCKTESGGAWESVSEKLEGTSLRTHLGYSSSLLVTYKAV